MKKSSREIEINSDSPLHYLLERDKENLINNYIPERLKDILDSDKGYDLKTQTKSIKVDEDKIVTKAYSYLANPYSLRKDIEDSSGSNILFSYSCQLAITILGDLYFAAPDEAGMKAGELMDLCGLKAFKPKLGSKRPYQQIIKFRVFPHLLEAEVSNMIEATEKYRDKSKSRTEDKKNIERAFRKIFGENAPADLLTSEKILDKTKTAISFISFKYRLPYRKLRETYSEIRKK